MTLTRIGGFQLKREKCTQVLLLVLLHAIRELLVYAVLHT